MLQASPRKVPCLREGLYFSASLNLDQLEMDARNAIKAINSPSISLYCDVDLLISDIKPVSNQVNLF